MLESVPFDKAAGQDARVIKRYSNRKLYDTHSSKYVTLLQIADMIRAGDQVQIIDNRTKEDKTEVTLALIISEELKNSPGGIPLTTLRALIRQDSELSPVIRTESGVPSGVHTKLEAQMGQSSDAFVDARTKLEQWQAAMDEKLRALPDSATVAELQGQVRHLNDRLAELERRFAKPSE
jgi:polyhydroxyalkanoate synthesis repressor PhaR